MVYIRLCTLLSLVGLGSLAYALKGERNIPDNELGALKGGYSRRCELVAGCTGTDHICADYNTDCSEAGTACGPGIMYLYPESCISNSLPINCTQAFSTNARCVNNMSCDCTEVVGGLICATAGNNLGCTFVTVGFDSLGDNACSWYDCQLR